MTKSVNLTREQKLRKLALLKERAERNARKRLIDFTFYTFPKFQKSTIHKTYYALLDLFAEGTIKKLIITMPPQHGKSEASTRRLPAYLFGHNPDLKIAVASYNTTFARKFNRDIQRIIDTPQYHKLFPKTNINSKNVVTVNNYLRNADEFEIVGHNGSLRAVGRGGALTGMPVDILLIDDLYKDYEEGNSQIVLESAWNWYTSVADSRLHNDSQQLIVFTRWNQDDLVGKLERKETVITLDEPLDSYDPDVWYKINFEAIKESLPTELDQRERNQPLWPERHSLEKLKRSRSLDPENFNSLYQGDPQPREGLLYKSFKTYDTLPKLWRVDSYTDTADTGKDYLCSVVYGVDNDNKIYIIDILYTNEPMEVTENMTAELWERNNIVTAYVESNNGGRGFGRAVEKKLSFPVTMEMFHQSGNKESRIYSNSAMVQNMVYFPTDWAHEWPEFYIAMKHFKKHFKANKHDDAPDAITGVVEKVLESCVDYMDVLTS